MAIQLQSPTTRKIVLISVISCAALYVYFMTTLVPFTFKANAATIKDMGGRYRVLSADITKAKQTLASVPFIEKEASLLHAKWTEAKHLLPDEEASASFLRAVTLLGDRSGIEFVLFRPLPRRPAQFYTEYPIELKVEGGYNEVGAFLGELANMERIVTLSELEIVSVKNDDAENPASASFIAKTYTLGGTGVPPQSEDETVVAKTVRQAKDLGEKQKSKGRGAPPEPADEASEEAGDE